MAIAERLADQFHAATLSGDVDTLRSILAPDVTFAGPLAEASGVEECIAGLVEMSRTIVTNEVLVRLSDNKDALIWSAVMTASAPPIQAATWLHIRDDRITMIRTVFDPGRLNKAA